MLSSQLIGCGYHLRSQSPMAANLAQLNIDSPVNAAQITSLLSQELLANKIQVSDQSSINLIISDLKQEFIDYETERNVTQSFYWRLYTEKPASIVDRQFLYQQTRFSKNGLSDSQISDATGEARQKLNRRMVQSIIDVLYQVDKNQIDQAVE